MTAPGHLVYYPRAVPLVRRWTLRAISMTRRRARYPLTGTEQDSLAPAAPRHPDRPPSTKPSAVAWSAIRRTSVGVAQTFSGGMRWQRRAAASAAVDGIGRDKAFVGGVSEDYRQQFDDAGDCGVGVAELAEVDDPSVDAERGDRREWDGAPAQEDVAAEHAAVVVAGAGVEVQDGEPGGNPLAEGDLGRSDGGPVGVAVVVKVCATQASAASLVGKPEIEVVCPLPVR